MEGEEVREQCDGGWDLITSNKREKNRQMCRLKVEGGSPVLFPAPVSVKENQHQKEIGPSFPLDVTARPRQDV